MHRFTRALRRRLPVVVAAALTATALSIPSGGPLAAPSSAQTAGLRQVMLVGNNWDGTADVVEYRFGFFRKIARADVVPDRAVRMAEIAADPIRLAIFMFIRNGPGEGHDQLVDDLYTSPEGRFLIASRPSFADVVSIDLTTGDLAWRFPVSGFRSDHMAMSPDGRTVAVSASTSKTVHLLDVDTGVELGSFGTGDFPHENVFTDDGTRIWNLSIGNVTTADDDPSQDAAKGDKHITIADAATSQVLRTIDMRPRLDAAGRPDLSNAVRPAVFTPDESKLYFQVSFFNGIVEYDVATDRITRTRTLPANPATNPDRTTWINDSRHHGLAMSPFGDKLCVAATMDDYATIVSRWTLREAWLIPASKPYWATVSGDGTACIISESGADKVTAIDFLTGLKLGSIAVGDHPQRIRVARVAADWTGTT